MKMQCFDDIERSDIIPIIVVVALCMAPIVGGAWGYVAGYGPYVILTLGVTTAICFVIFGLDIQIAWYVPGGLTIFFATLQSAEILAAGGLGG